MPGQEGEELQRGVVEASPNLSRQDQELGMWRLVDVAIFLLLVPLSPGERGSIDGGTPWLRCAVSETWERTVASQNRGLPW